MNFMSEMVRLLYNYRPAKFWSIPENISDNWEGRSQMASKGRAERAERGKSVLIKKESKPVESFERRPMAINDNPLQEPPIVYILDYKVVEPIEMGDFCPAYIVEKDDKKFVLKKMALSFPENDEIKQVLTNELSSLSKLSHAVLPLNFQLFIDNGNLYSIYGTSAGRRIIDFVFPDKGTTKGNAPQKVIKPDLERSIRWLRQLADGISYLHNLKPFQIIHRNINPSTLLLTDSTDEIRLLDFGLLNTYRNIADQATGGKSLLVPGSFSPQNIFNGGWTDSKTDIFSFGKLMDFLLTGIFPSDSSAPPAFTHLKTNLDSKLHERISNIIVRSMAVYGNGGYQTIDELTSDLDNVLSSVASVNVTFITCHCGFRNLESARLCRRCGRLLHETETSKKVDQELLQFDDSTLDILSEKFEKGFTSSLVRFQLRENLDEVQSKPGFDELVSLEELPLVVKMPHQQDAALKALKTMKGRALLADEVGLGKTIEAGMVLKELIRRSLASRILILCPQQLRKQWQAELYEKFHEIFLILGRDIDTPLTWFSDHIISSYNTIIDPLHKEILLSQNYDLVILDEAHNLNLPENAEILQVVKTIQKKYFLLLSATPMHSSLDELYNIITLLRPGHFEDIDKFQDEFVEVETMRPKQENILRLRHSLHEVMIRHSREQVSKEYHFPERNPQTWTLKLNKESREFYDDFKDFYKREAADITNPSVIKLLNSIVERLCSSKKAFGSSVASLDSNKYVQRQFRGKNFLVNLKTYRVKYPDSFITPKLEKLIELLTDPNLKMERVLVFSQYQETADFIILELKRKCPTLRERLKLYDEKSPSAERERVIEQFNHKDNQILICPGEASEGLNLQVCSFMINFDLPWDPMKLEQRIGRIQRIGGKHKINIINLVLENTIENDILNILQDKIKIFEAVIGQVEAIIGNIQDEVDIPTIIGNIFLERQMEIIVSKAVPQSDEENEEYDLEEKQVSPMEYLDSKMEQPKENSMLNEIFIDLDATDQI
jgi:ERCC4-related helicase